MHLGVPGTWERATAKAPVTHGDFTASDVVLNGRMWLMGGWYGGGLPNASASNSVYSSADGITWELATAAGPCISLVMRAMQ